MNKSNPISCLKRLLAVFVHRWKSHQGYCLALKCWLDRVCADLLTAMRSWRGRNEVDAMIQSPSLLETFRNAPSDNFSRKSGSVVIEKINLEQLAKLEYEYGISPSSEDLSLHYNPAFDFSNIPSELLKEWSQIGDSFNILTKMSDQGDIQNYKNFLRLLNKVSKKVEIYKLKYHSLISEDFKRFILIDENSREVNKKLLRSILFAENRRQKSKTASKKLQALNSYFEYLHLNLIPFIYKKRIFLHTLKFLFDVLEPVSSEKFIDLALNYKVHPRDKENFDFQMFKLEENSKIIRGFILYLNEAMSRIDEFSNINRDSAQIYTDKPCNSTTYKAIQSCLDNWDEWSDAMDTLARI